MHLLSSRSTANAILWQIHNLNNDICHQHAYQPTCFPTITKSTFSCSAILAKIFETCIGCKVSYSLAGTSTWIPLSIPMANAVLNTSCACCGPHDTAISSLANFFSFKRTASSTAISSNGFIECFTPSVTTPVLSGFTRICNTKSRSWSSLSVVCNRRYIIITAHCDTINDFNLKLIQSRLYSPLPHNQLLFSLQLKRGPLCHWFNCKFSVWCLRKLKCKSKSEKQAVFWTLALVAYVHKINKNKNMEWWERAKVNAVKLATKSRKF